jgi:hypothetical protein
MAQMKPNLAARRPVSTDPGEAVVSDKLTGAILATVVFVGGIAPLATDMYVPAFPLVARDLHASAAQVQLSLTTFFVGMALGQLIGGPVSDQRGRRTPLLAALVVLTLASLACASSPSIPIMLAARFVQGFAGGWAMVIARAVVVDLASGIPLTVPEHRRGRGRDRTGGRTADGRADPAGLPLAGVVPCPRRIRCRDDGGRGIHSP